MGKIISQEAKCRFGFHEPDEESVVRTPTPIYAGNEKRHYFLFSARCRGCKKLLTERQYVN
jgi:hypothetical protein